VHDLVHLVEIKDPQCQPNEQTRIFKPRDEPHLKYRQFWRTAVAVAAFSLMRTT
jgi:hypothetical protein